MKKVCISFDLWNTLILPNPDYAVARTEWLSSLSGKDRETCAREHRALKALMDNLNSYGISLPSSQCWELLFERLEYPNFSYEGIKAFISGYPPIMYEGLSDWLYSLGSRLALESKVALLSNTNFISGEVLRTCLKDKLPPWVYCLFSDSWGFSKPSPKFFNLLNLTEEEKKTAIHVGDSIFYDGKGAKQYGINFIKVTGPHETIEKVEEYLNAL